MKHLSSLLWSGFVSLQSTLCVAAEPPKHHRAVQPPGLYRVDWQAQSETVAEKGKAPVVMEGKIDGTSGDASNRLRSGATVREYAQKGDKPNTLCVHADTPAAQAAARASCPDHRVRAVDANTLSYVSNCPTIHTVRTVRRIDDKTWAIDTAIKLKGAPAAQFGSPTVSERWTRIADRCK